MVHLLLNLDKFHILFQHGVPRPSPPPQPPHPPLTPSFELNGFPKSDLFLWVMNMQSLHVFMYLQFWSLVYWVNKNNCYILVSVFTCVFDVKAFMHIFPFSLNFSLSVMVESMIIVCNTNHLALKVGVKSRKYSLV